MSTTIYQSSALVMFVQGEHIQDMQILIDNRELYNKLPGKLERHGIKTLASWPIFVTAVLNETQAEERSAYALVRHQSELSVRESIPEYQQIPFLDLTVMTKPTGLKAHKRKVAETLAQIRRLHDDLNQALYTSKMGELPIIHSPTDAFEIFNPFMSSLDHEELWVMNLDIRNRVRSLVKVYQGSLNQSQVRVCELFKAAIAESYANIIIAHNHPSGDPAPSPDDIALTRAIVQAGKLLDIEVLDHIVIGCGQHSMVSLKERGLGFGG
jgi:DNA repair protein RadC